MSIIGQFSQTSKITEKRIFRVTYKAPTKKKAPIKIIDLPSLQWCHLGDQLAHDLHLPFQRPPRRRVAPGELHRVARRGRRGRRVHGGVAATEDRGEGAFPKGLFLGPGVQQVETVNPPKLGI